MDILVVTALARLLLAAEQYLALGQELGATHTSTVEQARQANDALQQLLTAAVLKVARFAAVLNADPPTEMCGVLEQAIRQLDQAPTDLTVSALEALASSGLPAEAPEGDQGDLQKVFVVRRGWSIKLLAILCAAVKTAVTG